MKSFREYLTEEKDRSVVFTFGRFSPPTIGHEKLLNKVASVAKGGKYRIYASQSHDPQKNPLVYNDKVKFMRKMFPKHARSIILDTKIKNSLDVIVSLYDQGFTEVTMVVGSDRVKEFETLLNRYNGVKARHGFYNFENGIKVVSAGDRDPDAEGVEGMSASKMRQAAADNDFIAFSKGLPKTYKKGQELFNAVRFGMGLKESRRFAQHIELEKVSDNRESYIQGELFDVGDEVVLKESDEIATITHLGTNYVIVETAEGKKLRKWINSIEKI